MFYFTCNHGLIPCGGVAMQEFATEVKRGVCGRRKSSSGVQGQIPGGALRARPPEAGDK